MTDPTNVPEPPEPPPPGVKAMAVVRWAIIVVAAIAALFTITAYVRSRHDHGGAASGVAGRIIYQCPMHPQITSDQPGDCPICGMRLQPVAPERAAPPASASAPPLGDGGAPIPGTVPPGTVPIVLELDRVQSIGVRTAPAEARDVGGTLRVTAMIAAPEQGAAEVHVRAAGFVERIAVRETGVPVAQGQELFGLYSPDVFQAESELLAARSFGDAGARSVAASRQRLELLGMSPHAIDEVLASGTAARVIAVTSPTSGYVAKKNVVLGSYVTPETTLYEIVDLSKVYVVADVFPRDVAQIGIGTVGRFTPSQEGGQAVTAKVDLIYPQLNAEARTTRIRMQIANVKRELRPGQYGNVDFALGASKVVVVPRDAIVDTGRVRYVFVDEGSGRFTPRVVTLGREVGDDVQVLAGVVAGERVVASATFLVDSESRLQASLAHAAEPGRR